MIATLVRTENSYGAACFFQISTCFFQINILVQKIVDIYKLQKSHESLLISTLLSHHRNSATARWKLVALQ